jgi:hypothetical protein
MLVVAKRLATLIETSAFFKINPSLIQMVISKNVELPVGHLSGSLDASAAYFLALSQARLPQPVAADTTLAFSEDLS